MKQPLLRLLNNRVRRNYQGGKCLDRWEGVASPTDGPRPEDWLASTTPAVNRGMDLIENEGLGRVVPAGGSAPILADLFRDHGEYYLGREHLNRVGPHLGFLAKLLDSSMRLHTQVHPTREFARQYLNSPYGKLECYVILGVREEGPGLIRLGFQRAPTRERWREIIARQDIAAMDACFDPIPVTPGEVWWVPGGLVHALGAGLLLLEVMEPSDLVVRCEFNREGIIVPPEARFMGRDLEFCLDVFDYTPYSTADITQRCRVNPRVIAQSAAHEETLCISHDLTRCFSVRRLRVRESFQWSAPACGRLLIVVGGHGEIGVADTVHAVAPGSRLFAAAEGGPLVFKPGRQAPLDLLICQTLD